MISHNIIDSRWFSKNLIYMDCLIEVDNRKQTKLNKYGNSYNHICHHISTFVDHFEQNYHKVGVIINNSFNLCITYDDYFVQKRYCICLSGP